MYVEHPFCESPNPGIKIWRYLDEQKFTSLLEKEALFFAKARYLNDPFEGRYPPAYIRNEGAAFNRGVFGQMPFGQGPNYISDSIKNSTFICCFTMNEFENDAMWKSYLMKKEGVAIQSTFKQLQESFDKTKEENISIGMMKYYESEEDFDGRGNVFKLFLQKRIFFNNENELRAIMIKISDQRETVEKGVFIPINIKKFFNKVILSPQSDQSFEKRVKALCAQKGLENIVFRSKLEEVPKW